MASRADLVFENFVWRIEAITPTASEGHFGEFVYLETPHVDADGAPGRRFQIEAIGGGEAHVVDGDTVHTSGGSRAADHEFGVAVYYPAELNHRVLRRTMLKDHHDIVAQLGLGSSRVGYDDSNPSTDIGLWRRIFSGYSIGIDEDRGLLVLEQTWVCSIYETE